LRAASIFCLIVWAAIRVCFMLLRHSTLHFDDHPGMAR
jgi:hypothetical protein